MDKEKKFLLVDGSNLLFQMFYGMPSRIVNKEGKAIQGTLGFVGAFLKIVRLINPSHIMVLFDGECQNERKLLSSDYKANRVDYSQMVEEDTPFSQMPDVYKALDFMGIRHIETTFFETDDVIASYALKYEDDYKITIASFDSDFFQLINSNVSVLRYRGDKTIICDEEFIQTKFNISASQYADFKSLVGDTSDNINGAYKVGPKTAALLLKEFGSLHNILDNLEKIERKTIKESISKDKDKLLLNYRLIKLENKNTYPFELDDLFCPELSFTTTDVLKGIGLK